MRGLTLVPLFTLLMSAAYSQAPNAAPVKFRLDTVSGLKAVNARVEAITYRGRRAVRLTPIEGAGNNNESMLAVLTDTDFKDGTIEAEVAGAPRQGTPPDSRGFIGIEFRVQDSGSRSECFYLRPTNARADDQLRRNHTVQYVSDPEYTWQRLRKESPGMYESYVDLDAGAWTRMKIVVSGTKASLYVNGAAQPCLVVNDLKMGAGHGQIGLWAHNTTDAYFSNLTVQ